MGKNILALCFLLACAPVLSACVTPAAQQPPNLTAGVVQGSIEKGMSGAEVIEVLGSPNIISTDENGLEVWVYDRISSEVTRQESMTGVFGLLFLHQTSSGTRRSSQKTFTVILKFDEGGRVRDLAYHVSRF